MKHPNHVTAFARSHEEGDVWVKELCAKMPWLNPDDAYHLLRAVMHSLRDRLGVNELAHFSAQMPLILRGSLFEQWNPGQKKKLGRTREEFVDEIRSRIKINPKFEIEAAIEESMGLLQRHISEGEFRDICASLPNEIREFVESTRAEYV